MHWVPTEALRRLRFSGARGPGHSHSRRSDHHTDRRLTRRLRPRSQTSCSARSSSSPSPCGAPPPPAAARPPGAAAPLFPRSAPASPHRASPLTPPPASSLQRELLCGRPAPREQGAGVARCGHADGRAQGRGEEGGRQEVDVDGGQGRHLPVDHQQARQCVPRHTPAGRRRRQPPAPDAAAAAAAPRPAAARPPPLTRALRRPRSQRTRSR